MWVYCGQAEGLILIQRGLVRIELHVLPGMATFQVLKHLGTVFRFGFVRLRASIEYYNYDGVIVYRTGPQIA